jgi:ribosomal protein S27E
MDIKFKSDKYKKARGGYSRLLDISCEHCGNHLFFYQKDGPGMLKRMYLDRISESGEINLSTNLICPKCKKLLAVPIIYEKENRPALRLFVGAVTKKIVKSR